MAHDGRFRLLGILFGLWLLPGAALADSCLGPIARGPSLAPIVRLAHAGPEGHTHPSRASDAPLVIQSLGAGEVRIRYVGHATFTLESPRGIVAATDYNDYVRPAAPPHIATMNHAHSTHFTDRPDPAIRHVLRGWSMDGKPPLHDIRLDDMAVRNVPTNIRRGFSDTGTEYYGNSIFIFEAAGLCIAHLGHLHHVLTPEHLKAIGRIDVVLAAIDGAWTIDHAGILEVLGQLQPKLVIPMHYFSQGVLNAFLSRVGSGYDILRPGSESAILSFAKLPTKPAIMVLEGR